MHTLIVITGFPATGKTMLGRRISKDFNISFICKDDFKELIFDVLGYEDREWSRKIGRASYEILYHCAEASLSAKKSVIIETNFDPTFANQKIRELKNRYKCNVVQIRCVADREVLINRFEERALSGERHKGHQDAESLGEWQETLGDGSIEPLDIDSKRIDVNTTNFDVVNYESIKDEIEALIEK